LTKLTAKSLLIKISKIP